MNSWTWCLCVCSIFLSKTPQNRLFTTIRFGTFSFVCLIVTLSELGGWKTFARRLQKTAWCRGPFVFLGVGYSLYVDSKEGRANHTPKPYLPMDPDESIMSSSGIDGIGCEVAKKARCKKAHHLKAAKLFPSRFGSFFYSFVRLPWGRQVAVAAVLARACHGPARLRQLVAAGDVQSIKATLSASGILSRSSTFHVQLPGTQIPHASPATTLHVSSATSSPHQSPPTKPTSSSRKRTYNFPFQATIRFHHQLALDMRRHFHTPMPCQPVAPSSTSTTSTAEPPTPVPSTGNHPPPPPPRRGVHPVQRRVRRNWVTQLQRAL